MKALKNVGLWLGITLLVLLAGAVWIMIEYTLVNRWVFFGFVAALAAGLTFVGWWRGVAAGGGQTLRRTASGSWDSSELKVRKPGSGVANSDVGRRGRDGERRSWLVPLTDVTAVRVVTTWVLLMVVLSGLTLGVNYYTADFDGVEPSKGVITRKYQQTRHRTKRSGRHGYERGEPYQVYKVDLQLLSDESGGEFEDRCGDVTVELNRGRYAKVHKGDTVSVAVAKGGLGLRVIKPSTMKR